MTENMTLNEASFILANIDRRVCDDELNEALDMAIKALEILEEFEKAQIITGGRLNGRTYAYKCGLEDGKRKALEQEPCDDATLRDIFCMGCEYKEQEPCEDCVSRNAIRLKIAEMPKYTDGKKLASIRHLKEFLEKEYPLEESIEVTPDICIGFTIAIECIGRFIKSLPSVAPTRKKGKWIAKSFHEVYCDNCKFDFDIMTNEFIDKMKYCPNCGSKMEVEDDSN